MVERERDLYPHIEQYQVSNLTKTFKLHNTANLTSNQGFLMGCPKHPTKISSQKEMQRNQKSVIARGVLRSQINTPSFMSRPS